MRGSYSLSRPPTGAGDGPAGPRRGHERADRVLAGRLHLGEDLLAGALEARRAVVRRDVGRVVELVGQIPAVLLGELDRKSNTSELQSLAYLVCRLLLEK